MQVFNIGEGETLAFGALILVVKECRLLGLDMCMQADLTDLLHVLPHQAFTAVPDAGAAYLVIGVKFAVGATLEDQKYLALGIPAFLDDDTCDNLAAQFLSIDSKQAR